MREGTGVVLAVLAPNPLLRAALAALLRTMGFDPTPVSCGTAFAYSNAEFS